MVPYIDPLWLCWNNFVYLLLAPWLWYISTLREDIDIVDWSWEVITPISLTLASLFNHMCTSPDVLICVAGQPQNTLFLLDLYWALTLMCAVVSIQMPERSRLVWFPVMRFISMVLVVLLPDGTVATITIFSLVVITYFYYRITPLILHPEKHWSAVLGLAVFGVAIFFKQDLGNYPLDTPDDIAAYSFWHGWWHILSALGAALIIWDSRHAPNYYA
jgi:hypothetical protein